MRIHKGFLIILCAFVFSAPLRAQHAKNLVIVTLDGMRWQEVFGGVDSALMNSKLFTRDSADVAGNFWSSDIAERRRKLFPFLFGTVLAKGQLYGDRWNGSEVNNANPYKFSYPGYNEIFTGYPDPGVNSNDTIRNPNPNVLEFLNKQPGFAGRIAAFSTWLAFPYILNRWRSGVYVNADYDSLAFSDKPLQLIQDAATLSAKPDGERLDILTYLAAREYLKLKKPRVLYVAFDETDDFAHAGLYDQYLKAAHAEDAMIADLWKTLQSMPEYRDNTALIVTCDHGRGDAVKSEWTSHGEKVMDAGHIWIAALGAGIRPLGEVKTTEPVYQKQLAPTFAALLGFSWAPAKGNSTPIATLIAK